ncbi:MAG TPA: 50S ribosomal protein L23 [Firmicutes bacterium]|uniref:Large ribosomal subunit protein uL23 n=1 Tax=candidate division TA06 bacterium TaxID=2250710 RepID=A0A660S5J7_UNCT6|nr:50S ribosomal protein L23 [candidate division WOR-3 bacterium]RKX64876.1 MAG: 50S ribosomal protein L23 [candidate division TA06 bacterium]HFD04837.1 50S ribosomal protein L23 [Bacillota bacterium]
MKDARDIIIRPILTEKSLLKKENENRYYFEVSRDSNKIEIKKAVEELFKVHVLDVTVSWSKGKIKKLGRSIGKRPDIKKACCKIKQGEKIDAFEV